MAKRKTKQKIPQYAWIVLAIAILIGIMFMTSGEEGGALAKFSAAKVTPTPTAVTYLGVLSILNNCDSDIVENGKNCNTYCATRFTNGICIASEVLEPISYGTGLEGTRQNCNQDGYRKMCTCCAP
jgi:hypothetical protein